MYALEEFREEVRQVIEKAADVEVKPDDFSVPPDPQLGDLACSVAFRLAKDRKKNPKQVAEDISSGIKLLPDSLVKQVKTAGPYINFYIDYSRFAGRVIEESAGRYGSRVTGKSQKVTIDFSHPNIAKPFTVGHLRSTIIGQAIYKCLEYQGYKCIGINHLGDWGTQFGKLMAAYKLWGDKKKIEKDPIKECLALYVKFHKEAENDSKLEDEGRKWFKKLEDGDKEARELWKWFYDLSIKKFQEMYELMNVHFDSFKGESYYAESGLPKEIIKKAVKKGIAVAEPDGAIVVQLEEHGMPNFLIQKEDGATLYSTRDLAAAYDRWNEYKFAKNIYVVGGEQQLYFKSLFKTMELMGYKWADRCEHVWFGLVMLPGGGKMSTRKGKTVFLEDVLNESIARARRIVEEKNPSLSKKEKDSIAKAVGIGAIKFADLSHNKIKNIEFDWDRMLDFEGDTAPYLQYAHARCTRILEKVGKVKAAPDYALLATDEEKQLVKKLSEFPDATLAAAMQYATHTLAEYLLELTHAFSNFYMNCHVIRAETEELSAARLELVKATKNVLRIGLDLLGIEAPERM